MIKNKLALGLLITISIFVAAAVTFLGLSLSGVAPVLKNDISITSNTYTKVYNGKAAESDEYILRGTLYSGDSLDISFDELGSDIGTYTNSFVAKVVNKNGKDVSGNYNIHISFGTLTITQREIRLTVKSEKEPYNGQKLTAKDYILSGELAEGDKLDITYEGEITEVGETNASLYAHVKNSSDVDVTANYKISTVDGILVKELVPLTITSDSFADAYSGNPLTKDTYTLEGETIPGETLQVDITGEITYVGYVDNAFTAVVLDGEGNDVSYHYDIQKNYGVLRVTEKDITFTSKSHQDYVYDGTAHKVDPTEPLTTSVPLAEKDEYTFVYTNSITNTGSVASNTFAVSITNKETHEDVSKNYHILYQYGFLEVQPRQLVIITNSKEKKYDGTPLKDHNITYDPDRIAPNETLSLVTGTSITNAGTATNVVTVKITNILGQTVTSNYKIIYQYGTLTVNPLQIELMASSAQKDYDGTPLISTDWYKIKAETAPGEFMNVTVTGSLVGRDDQKTSCENVISCDIRDITGALISNWQNNYNVKLTNGELIVHGTEKSIIYLAPANKYVTKTELDAAGGIVDAKDVDILGFTEFEAQNYAITADVVGSLTGVGKIATTIDKDSITIKRNDNLVSNAQFEIILLPGVLQVYEKEITITTLGATKKYDKTALTKNMVEIEDASVKVDYVITGSQTAVGVSYNTIQVNGIYDELDTAHLNNLIDKYKINYNLGTLVVERAIVEIETGKKSVSHEDGEYSVYCKDFEVVSGLASGDFAYVKKYVTLSETGTMPNNLEFSFVDSLGNDVSDNYIVVITKAGLLEITEKHTE